MHIALFDYKVISNNPIGSCNLKLLKALSAEHTFVVFAVEFENPNPERIRWVRVPCPMRPLALLFAMFHLLAPLCYWWHCLARRERFDAIHMVESDLAFGDLSYAHFCHRSYLKHQWRHVKSSGIRRWLTWCDHWLHAIMEPWVFHRTREIVVPSEGLARELTAEYPAVADKIRVLANPVDLDRMRKPVDFERMAIREMHQLKADDFVIAFAALGHFERKGLPLLLDAVAMLKNPRLKLLIIGGREDTLANYRKRVGDMGISDAVRFVGMQRDVRPFLWSSDAFTLPSFYEVFPLVALEAAAAGLPLIVTRLNGVEEFIADGKNGILVERSAESIGGAIKRLLSLPADAGLAMQAHVRKDVERYDTSKFNDAWRDVYAGPEILAGVG